MLSPLITLKTGAALGGVPWEQDGKERTFPGRVSGRRSHDLKVFNWSMNIRAEERVVEPGVGKAFLHSLRNGEKRLQEMLWDPWRGRGLKTPCACNTQTDTGLDQEDFARHLLLHVGTFLPGHNPKFPPVTLLLNYSTETSNAESSESG